MRRLRDVCSKPDDQVCQSRNLRDYALRLFRHRRAELLLDPIVPLRFQLQRHLGAAGQHDAAVVEDVDVIGLDVVQQPLVVRDQQRAHVRADQAVDALGDHPQRVDVQARVGLVQHGDLRFEHGHLQDLGAFLFAAREAIVQIAAGEGGIDVQLRHLVGQFLAEFAHRHQLGADGLGAAAVGDGLFRPLGVAAHRADRLAQEVRHADARDRGRVLERQEQTGLGALVGRQAEDALPVQQDVAAGDYIMRVAGNGISQGALPGAVRPHRARGLRPGGWSG